MRPMSTGPRSKRGPKPGRTKKGAPGVIFPKTTDEPVVNHCDLVKPVNVLSARESKMWNHIVAGVAPNHFSHGDEWELVQLCRDVCEWRTMSKRLANTPGSRLGITRFGEDAVHPAHRIERDLARDIRNQLKDLGMVVTPGARRSRGEANVDADIFDITMLLDGEKASSS